MSITSSKRLPQLHFIPNPPCPIRIAVRTDLCISIPGLFQHQGILLAPTLCMSQLVFPNIGSLVAFLFEENMSNIEVNSKELTLTGELTQEQTFQAIGFYGAILVTKQIPTDELDDV